LAFPQGALSIWRAEQQPRQSPASDTAQTWFANTGRRQVEIFAIRQIRSLTTPSSRLERWGATLTEALPGKQKCGTSVLYKGHLRAGLHARTDLLKLPNLITTIKTRIGDTVHGAERSCDKSWQSPLRLSAMIPGRYIIPIRACWPEKPKSFALSDPSLLTT